MLLVQVAGGLILVVLVLAFVLRGRLGASRATRTSEVRPTSPVSPYQSSRGFKIIDGTQPEAAHQVQLPRLDPNTEFVFHDPAASSETLSAPHLRHDEKWALDRSMRRVPHPRVRRRRRVALGLAVSLAAAGVAAGVWLTGHP